MHNLIGRSNCRFLARIVHNIQSHDHEFRSSDAIVLQMYDLIGWRDRGCRDRFAHKNQSTDYCFRFSIEFDFATTVTFALGAAPVAVVASGTGSNVLTARDTIVNSNPATFYTATAIREKISNSHKVYVLG